MGILSLHRQGVLGRPAIHWVVAAAVFSLATSGNAGQTDSAGRGGSAVDGRWFAATGSGSARTPEERLSLAAEVFITHDHFDETSSLPCDAGLMVDRHIWPGRYIKPPRMIGRDSKGEDETPAGAFLSLASAPRGDDGLGGELPAEGDKDRRSRHQREWDFLAGHVEKAFQIYRARRVLQQSALVPSEPARKSPADSLSEWDRFSALAQYALQWKLREESVYPSFHPVDVLFHSSYCTGAANVLHALAMVAGFESRFIALTYHSMVEVRVDGRWVWADNYTVPGALTPGAHSYAEVTADPNAIPYLTKEQRADLGTRTATYRSPYHYAGRYYWHFCWGDKTGRAARDDIADGYGLTVAYDPSTALALYPESRRHVFHVPRSWPAAVNLCEKGAFVRAGVPLAPGGVFRKRFYIGPSLDNPVTGGKVKLWVGRPGEGRGVECVLDGKPLACTGEGRRFKQPTVEYTIPAGLLSPGIHELQFRCPSGSAPLIFYPDIVQPYAEPILGKPLHVPNEAFSVEPCVGDRELEELAEPF